MGIDLDVPESERSDEAYYDDDSQSTVFDARLLKEPLSVLPTRSPILFAASASATEGMRAMKRERRGCILVTEDGTSRSRLCGIFTERDVLLRIIDRGRNPASVSLDEVMTPDPECLEVDGKVAWVLNMMSVGGFRHVPVVDDAGRPVAVISVRDVVQFLVEAFPSEILNLPPRFAAGSYTTRGGA